jgi:hypothetical protein
MNDDDDLFSERDSSEEPRWRRLDISDRQELLSNVFSEDDEWYDGAPYYKGGTQNPDFNGIVRACGAPLKEVKRYYVAWLRKKGCDPKAAMIPNKDETSQISHTGAETYSARSQPVESRMPTIDFDDVVELKAPPGASSDTSGMFAMMQFLTAQQGMAMKQQQFQMQMMMEQRRFDESRQGDMRREQMSRDQQFMSQQTTLLKETMKRSSEGDGFFDGDMKKHMKERFVEQLMGGGGDDSWKDTVKDVLGSETLRSAVSGLGTALTNKASRVPAGYDVPNYNPYAQELHRPIQQVQQQYYDPEPQYAAGVFGEDHIEPQQSIPQEVSKDEYKNVLFNSFKDMLGAAMQDPQVAAAVQTQIDVAVDITLLEIPEALPQFKLQRMSEKMLLVRNLRDICFGLRDLRSRVPQGSPPNGIVMAAVISELRNRPEFYKIFAENNYESLVSQLDPFKDTGAIRFDYDYLLKPEIAEIARHMLNSVAQDAQTNGIPATETQ